MKRREVALKVWQQEGVERFGTDPNRWLFKCPSCGQVQSLRDMQETGADKRAVAWGLSYSCIGNLNRKRVGDKVVGFMEPTQGWGCMYEGGGNNCSPVALVIKPGEVRFTFEWADPKEEECADCCGDRVLCGVCEKRLVDCGCPKSELRDCDCVQEQSDTHCPRCLRLWAICEGHST